MRAPGITFLQGEFIKVTLSRVLVAVLAFGFGLLTQAVVANLNLTPDEDISPVLAERENELHKLYEAAGMTGDMDLQSAWQKELECLGEDGLLDALPVDRDGEMWCVRRDGTEYRTNRKGFDDFMSKHAQWSVNNLSFLEEVGTAKKARQYVAHHPSPQGTR